MNDLHGHQVIRWGNGHPSQYGHMTELNPVDWRKRVFPDGFHSFVNIDIYFTCILLSLFLQTTFLQGLLGRNMKYLATMNKEHLPRYAINTVYIYGQERYLMVTGSNLYFAKIDNFFWLNYPFHIILVIIASLYSLVLIPEYSGLWDQYHGCWCCGSWWLH